MLSQEEIERRIKHHPPKDEETKVAHEDIRKATKIFLDTINTVVPQGREQSTAITKVEEAMFWANAGIARNS